MKIDNTRLHEEIELAIARVHLKYRTELKRIRDALFRYGVHDRVCTAGLATDDEADLPCSCGFSEALKPQPDIWIEK